MGYIIGLIIVLLVLPLLFMLLSRRTRNTGGIDSRDHGVTPSRPSSDQPTPRTAAQNRRIPPG
jgi:hypothetical protein